ncbi:hypothetical protein CCB80_03975 [Armatimonadetes bacterium Uphvl-Ar1]|nr:hypothetical protein CCB80_03975 [Armatimonadetes bacterium Uphvl-Ar1]
MSRRVKAIAITTGLIGATVGAVLLYPALFPKVLLVKKIPAEVLRRQPEIQVAYRQYQSKGNEYIWGTNDCSILVMDYILATGNPVPFRPTTETLMSDKFMREVGFNPEKTIKTGDILVYRYKNHDNEWRGHTGVVVWHDNRQWVVHNAASHEGVVMEDLEQFQALTARLTKSNKNQQKIFRRNDWNSWYAEFVNRRDNPAN